jgi:hypothetical protein
MLGQRRANALAPGNGKGASVLTERIDYPQTASIEHQKSGRPRHIRTADATSPEPRAAPSEVGLDVTSPPSSVRAHG